MVSRNILDKMLSMKAVSESSNAADHAMAVANVDALFANDIHGWKKEDAEADSNIAFIHRLFSPMQTPDGRILLTKLTIKETLRKDRDNPLYSVGAIEFDGGRPLRLYGWARL